MPSVGTQNGMYNVLMPNGNSATTSNGSSANSTQATFSPPGQAVSSSSGEEISTIFVVGFPDDMQEREFQNMFLFCPGFEAATLKIPSKDQQQQQEDNNNNNSDLPNGGSGARKQIIGFAKFRTRLEALEAKDILSGRKVDTEKGSVLKAEMAKKNLHTKRTTAGEQQQPLQQPFPLQQQQLVPSTSYPLPSQHPLSSKRYSINANTVTPSAYEAFHSVPPVIPTDLHPPNELSYPDYYSDPFSPGGAPLSPTYHEPPMFVPRATSFDTRSASMGDIFGSMMGMPPTSSSRLPSGFNPGHRFSTRSLADMDNGASDRPNLFGSIYPVPPVQQQQQQQPAFPFASPPMNALNSVPEEMYPLYLPSQQPPTVPADPSLSEAIADHPSPLPSLSSRFAGLDINTSTSTTFTINGGLPSPGLTSPTGFRSFSSVLGVTAPGTSNNTADQNPPCNTLYIGNLPHNADEEELKAMFSKCPGYLRLSFRNKANGPMCFVEFEDVACATQAMHELHGNVLSNSVKGGIRLSFSKNPLGVRPPSALDGRRDSKHQAFDQLQ